ncbi:DUF2341 domain-containing protein [Thermococcus sp. 18S1]|uniref:DUF2341 domain-containing protein n=1 Tax=Thermococcus sp. 18S1 TaxID=1638210 RepID=UPI00143CB063|nr:DUF2341 domain-containing protein [Thermococcus sp. 18S1]NJE31428.1 DUF2341 domain-containing protein [Thermococcus sp. 18S1]
MNRVRIKFLAVVFALLILGTFGLAVPRINVDVQEIGTGSQRLISPVLQGSIWFNSGLTQGELVFSEDLPVGTQIYVSLRDANDNTIAYNYSIVLTADLTAGSILEYALVNPSGASRSAVVRAVVTVITPNYQTTFTAGNILVTSRELGVGVANTTVFCTPITVTENSGQTLYDYSILIVLDDSNNGNNETWKVDWNIINETNIYFTDDAGNPLYFWIQRVDTNNRIAYLWVKLPLLVAGSSRTLCLNYGVWPNPYGGYNNVYRTFLFVDDFNTFNPSAWESNVPVTVTGGYLALSANQWVWTKKTFGTHYAVHIGAYLVYDDGTRFNNAPNTNTRYYSLGPFLMGYIAPDNRAYTEGIGARYGTIWGFDSEAKGLLTFTLPGDPDITGYWDASRTNNQYYWNIGVYITMTFYNGRLSFYQKSPDGNWGIVSTYTRMSSYAVTVTGDGRIGFGQWSDYNNIPSRYYWVVVRNYVNPEPSVSVGLWYYKLVFHPRPPTTTVAGSLPTAVAPTSVHGLNGALLTGKSVPLRLPANYTPLVQMNNGTGEGIKELVSNFTLSAEGLWNTTPPFSSARPPGSTLARSQGS